MKEPIDPIDENTDKLGIVIFVISIVFILIFKIDSSPGNFIIDKASAALFVLSLAGLSSAYFTGSYTFQELLILCNKNMGSTQINKIILACNMVTNLSFICGLALVVFSILFL